MCLKSYGHHIVLLASGTFMSRNTEEIISQQLFYEWNQNFSRHFELKCFLCSTAEMELKLEAGTAQSVQYLACGIMI